MLIYWLIEDSKLKKLMSKRILSKRYSFYSTLKLFGLKNGIPSKDLKVGGLLISSIPKTTRLSNNKTTTTIQIVKAEWNGQLKTLWLVITVNA